MIFPPPEVVTVATDFTGLPQEEVNKIHPTGRLEPVSLDKLRHLKGIEDKYREDRVSFDGDVFKDETGYWDNEAGRPMV